MRSTYGLPLTTLTILFVALAGCPSLPPAPNSNLNGSNANENVSDDDNAPLVVFTDPKSVTLSVVAPAGAAIDAGALTVRTLRSSSPASGGSATVDVLSDYPSFVQAFNAADKPVLAGFVTPGGTNQLTARTTAAAAIFYAMGGYALPADRVQSTLALILGSPECDAVEAALISAMTTNPTAFADGDASLVQAVEAARVSLLARAQQAPPTGSARFTDGSPAERSLSDFVDGKTSRFQGSSDGQILLSPDANARLSGVQVLQNDAGGGVIAQNNFRRQCVLLPYYVGFENADGLRTDVTPELTGSGVDVQGSVRLGATTALGSLVGATPWAPVRSGVLTLPRPSDDPKHSYKLVLLGPSLTGGGLPPSLNTPEFAAFQADWEERVRSLQFGMFVFDFFVPTLEFLLLGTASNISVDARTASVELFREAMEPTLIARGFPLAVGTSEYLRGAVIASLQELRENPTGFFSRNVLERFQETLPPAVRNQATLESLETGLQRALAARTIVLAVESSFAGADLLAVMRDISASSTVDVWDATVIERRVRLTPQAAEVNVNSPTATFDASVVGRNNDRFLYRWSTTGRNGKLFDNVGGEGTVFDSSQSRVQYVANAGISFSGDLDTVTVEIFENTSLGIIPQGAIAVGSTTAVVRAGEGTDNGDDEPTILCPAQDVDTRPQTELFNIAIPRTIALGERMLVVITLDGPEIERLTTGGRQSQVLATLRVSGAAEFVRAGRFEEILIDGSPAFASGQAAGNAVTLFGNGLAVNSGSLLEMDTRTRTQRTFSVPIDFQEACEGSDGNFVSVTIQVSRDPTNSPPERYRAFEQFVITD